VSLIDIVPNSVPVIRSVGEVIRSNSECENMSVGQQFAAAASCVQSLRSPVVCSVGTFMSPPPSALSPAPRLSPANKPVAVNWDIRRSPVSALNALGHMSRTAAVERFPIPNASRFPTVGHSPENSRHRSVKAGSTWFPTEFQTSSDCDTAKRRSSSARPGSASSGSMINSPLKKFVDRHPTRTVSSQTRSQSSESGSYSRNGIAASTITGPSLDQPIDLSVQRQTFPPQTARSSQSTSDKTSSDEPLDLSQPSSSARFDRRIPSHPSQLSRQSDFTSKPLSGKLDMQNYCNRLLTGGYSVDSPLSTTSSSPFLPLVRKKNIF